jgi:chemotaxis signal transduction protein
MDDRAGLQPVEGVNSGARSGIVFTLAGERFALPTASVEAVAAPPPLALVPHATKGLLGVGNLGGQIVPILDIARLLDRERGAGGYDGGGEIIRLRIPGGSVGMWVDRVERLAPIGSETPAALPAEVGCAQGGPEVPDDIALIDPIPLLIAALTPPILASGTPAPLGEIAERVLPAAPAAIAEPFVLVEAAGKQVRLRREAVVELIEAVPWTRIPRAPVGLRGVGVLRGSALPVLSLAALLGLAEPAAPGSFAVTEVLGRRALLAVDRIVGLRFARQPGSSLGDAASPEEAAEDVEPIDLATAASDELRQIVLGFSQSRDDTRSGDSAIPDPTTEYLAFTVAGQDFAVPIGCVDRVVGVQRLIKLPRPANDDADPAQIVGAIELRGHIVPVAALQSRLGLTGDCGQATGPEPRAYVILRGTDGLGAIGVDQIKRVAALRPSDIVPPPTEHELIAGVVAPGAEPGTASENGGLLRIIAPARLWREG